MHRFAVVVLCGLVALAAAGADGASEEPSRAVVIARLQGLRSGVDSLKELTVKIQELKQAREDAAAKPRGRSLAAANGTAPVLVLQVRGREGRERRGIPRTR